MGQEKNCPQPLCLDMSNEVTVRQYGVALDIALRGDQVQLRQHGEYLGRIVGSGVSAYIIKHAMADATDLNQLPVIAN